MTENFRKILLVLCIFYFVFGLETALATTTVSAWGYNNYGQSNVPAGLTNVKAISAGQYHSLALKDDGTVVAWGSNVYGQSTVPVGLTNVKAISAGGAHSLAIKDDRTVVAWGDNEYGQSNVPVGLTNVIATSGGYRYSLALKDDGTVVAWGSNNYGQSNVPAGLSNVIAISVGSQGWHSLALKDDGTVVAWGGNEYGQSNVPAGLSNVIAISAGVRHSMALKNDGTVVAWGDTYYGQSNVPAGLTNVIATSGGYRHSLALKDDGTVVAWGSNVFGETNVPAGLPNVIAISAGYGFSMALYDVSESDLIEPTTIIELSGTKSNNNWYASNVQASLTATDNEGGSGVGKTEYSFDEGATWNLYSIPLIISSEGTTTVLYKSTDWAGNVEQIRTQEIKIDKAPSIAIYSPQAKYYLYTESITLNFEALDPISGIDSITSSLDGMTVINSQVIDLGTLTMGQHTFTVNAIDNAGNSAGNTVTFNIIEEIQQVPEFPTAAFPILSGIGLMFLFQRRKGK